MPNRCLKEPIPEIFEVSQLLLQAVDSHVSGEFELAASLIKSTDLEVIREWTESIWGIGGIYSGFKNTLGEPAKVPENERDPIRMPDKKMQLQLLQRDGHYCKFCGIPVIRKEVREYLKKHYPNELHWGKRNTEQHAAFQAMWVQYDHLVPHARGGRTIMENMLITCAPCNYGRMNYLIEEVGLTFPEIHEHEIANWNGLEQVMMKTR